MIILSWGVSVLACAEARAADEGAQLQLGLGDASGREFALRAEITGLRSVIDRVAEVRPRMSESFRNARARLEEPSGYIVGGSRAWCRGRPCVRTARPGRAVLPGARSACVAVRAGRELDQLMDASHLRSPSDLCASLSQKDRAVRER